MNICSCITDLIIVNLKLTQHRKSTIFHYMFFFNVQKKKKVVTVLQELSHRAAIATPQGEERKDAWDMGQLR